MSAERARSALRASIDSCGKRAFRSTSSAFGAATSSAIRRIGGQESLVPIDGDASCRGHRSFSRRAADRGHALEHAPLEHRVRELDVELRLEAEHEVDGGV